MSEQHEQDVNKKGGVQSQTPTTRTEKAPKPAEPKLLPPWKVILHNDDTNQFEDVVKAVFRLTPLNEQEAQDRTNEAHREGAAMLLVTHQERAELYVEQFASCGLTTSIEPDA